MLISEAIEKLQAILHNLGDLELNTTDSDENGGTYTAPPMFLVDVEGGTVIIQVDTETEAN